MELRGERREGSRSASDRERCDNVHVLAYQMASPNEPHSHLMTPEKREARSELRSNDIGGVPDTPSSAIVCQLRIRITSLICLTSAK